MREPKESLTLGFTKRYGLNFGTESLDIVSLLHHLTNTVWPPFLDPLPGTDILSALHGLSR